MNTILNEAEWEKLCLRCGQCCHIKIRTKNGQIHVVSPTEVCEYLQDNSCTIYKDRLHQELHQAGCSCIHIKEALQIEYSLPTSCPYTKLKPGYKGFIMPSEKEFDETFLLCIIIDMAERNLERIISPEEIENIKTNLKKGIKG